MKAKKLVAVGLAAVMATASMGTTAFADGLELEAHPDQTYYMVTFLSGYSFWTECWRGFQDAGKNARSRSQIWRNNRIRR